MKVLIVGNGGREHALAWKFAQSRRISGLYTLPGNAGTELLGHNLGHVSMTDPASVVEAARSLEIDLVFVGPETPLSLGLVDELEKVGIPTVGPNKQCAQLESSKEFSKGFLQRNKLPTAEARVFSDRNEFAAYIDASSGPLVVKKSGLAAGKGVLESDNKAELLAFGEQFIKEDSVLVEEYLRGFEVSIFTISDGMTYRILPSAADYKKAHNGNLGPNTGGMGAIAPVPWLDRSMLARIEAEIVKPTFDALAAEKLMYKGILYFGLMITDKGPKILEFNVRFGDPEAQVLIPLIQSDFCDLWDAVVHNRLSQFDLKVSNENSVGVVIAAPGYPGDYLKHLPVDIQFKNHEIKRILFHAATYREGTQIKTSGGRCFTCIGLGGNPEDARAGAYSLSGLVGFQGAWSRKDIGANVYSQQY